MILVLSDQFAPPSAAQQPGGSITDVIDGSYARSLTDRYRRLGANTVIWAAEKESSSLESRPWPLFDPASLEVGLLQKNEMVLFADVRLWPDDALEQALAQLKDTAMLTAFVRPTGNSGRQEHIEKTEAGYVIRRNYNSSKKAQQMMPVALAANPAMLGPAWDDLLQAVHTRDRMTLLRYLASARQVVLQPTWLETADDFAELARKLAPEKHAAELTIDATDLPESWQSAASEEAYDKLRSVVVASQKAIRGRPRLFFAIKRAIDIAGAVIGLALTLPLYPLIMLAIRLDSKGPVFFVHARQTLGGKEFGCLKFRSMKPNSDHLQKQLENDVDGPHFHMEKDPRLTRVGRILRKTNLDEVPQFWNVLLGHMSLVGPRPSPDRENQYCPAWREARLSVRPGLTGMWQIMRSCSRSDEDFQEWIIYDIKYIQECSLRTDAKLLWLTAVNIAHQVLLSVWEAVPVLGRRAKLQREQEEAELKKSRSKDRDDSAKRAA